MTCRLTTVLFFIVQAFLVVSSAVSCPPKCICTPKVVNCEDKGLTNANLTTIVSQMSNETEVLYLGRNELTDFSLHVFENLTALMELELDNNKLKRVPDNRFGYVKRLKVLNMEYNSLTALNGDDFKGYGWLHVLFLSNNNLVSLTKNDLKYLVHLREIHLDNNHIHGVLDQTFHFNRDLHQISIVNNIVTRLVPGLFDHLTYLEEVFLYGNQLTFIPDFIISMNQRLKRIEFSHNRISEISEYAFANMSNIGTVDIDLSYNTISTFQVSSFAFSGELYVAIDANLWHCSCPFLAAVQKVSHQDHVIFEGGICQSPSKLIDRAIDVTSLSPNQVGCNLCDIADCMNGADCTVNVEKKTFQCYCKYGFEGRYCEKRKSVTEVCGNHTCPESQVCVPVDYRSYVCMCLNENGAKMVCDGKIDSEQPSVLVWVISGVCIVVIVTAVVVFVLFLRRRRNKHQRNILIDENDDNEDL
ncbi:chondroadherin-like [Clytia hemisphaerica]|uniref:EGF-like domain-containing protein n=1 Tax=Clytia hemisphaerica TaxID=252671 RepID=A0A7M5VAZ5_9CNID